MSTVIQEPWREPVRGGHPDAGEFALTGADQLNALLTGATPAPPMSRLIGTRLVGTGPGEATFVLPLSGWLRGGDGRIPPGVLVMPADAAMACAIMTGLPARMGLTTTELALRRVRPVPESGRLLARARVIDPGGPLALAEAALRDEAGALIAHATSTCFLMPDVPVASDWEASAAATADATPDPWQRAAPRWPADDGEPAPLHRLTGLREGSAGHGEASFTLPATRWLCAPPPGRLQGGAVAMLADAAMSAAVDSAAPPGSAFVPAELKLNYLRPLMADGREARVSARVVNAGRRLVVSAAEVRDADERLIAVATGSSIAAALAGGARAGTA